MRARLTEQAQRDAERRFEIDARLLEIMEIVVAEWRSDPMSVQCFDLRIVEEAERLCDERKRRPLPFDF